MPHLKLLPLANCVTFLVSAYCATAVAQTGSEPEAAFPLSTVRNFVSNLRADQVSRLGDREFMLDAQRPGLAVVMKSTGRVRQIVAPKLHILERFFKAFKDGPLAQLYHREVEVDQDGHKYWMPIQDRLADEWARDVKPGAYVGMDLRYLGNCSIKAFEPKSKIDRAEFIFVMISFRDDATPLPKKTTCFADSLLGIKPGDDFGTTSVRLQKKYGKPLFAGKRDDERTYEAYVVDAARNTIVSFANGGPQYPQRVHLVQLSGDSNRQLEPLREIHFGDVATKVESQIGKANRVIPVADGYIQWSFENSPCSLEFKDGRLTSIQIKADPYYFLE